MQHTLDEQKWDHTLNVAREEVCKNCIFSPIVCFLKFRTVKFCQNLRKFEKILANDSIPYNTIQYNSNNTDTKRNYG